MEPKLSIIKGLYCICSIEGPDFVLFELNLFGQVNNFSFISGRVVQDWTSTKQQIKLFAKGHNTVTTPLASLELSKLLSPV